MRVNGDLKRRDEAFAVGELVFLKLQPYQQHSLARIPFEKLTARYYGPFEILARVGLVAYKLKLPDTSKLHPVFHVSQLRRAIGNVQSSSSIPEQLVKPAELLQVCRIGQGQVGRLEVLIKWQGLQDFEATWEDAAPIEAGFPDFHLEDKVSVWGRDNVIHFQDVKTYSRCKKKYEDGQRAKESDGKE